MDNIIDLAEYIIKKDVPKLVNVIKKENKHE